MRDYQSLAHVRWECKLLCSAAHNLHHVHQKIMCSQRANALLFCDIRIDLQHITFGS